LSLHLILISTQRQRRRKRRNRLNKLVSSCCRTASPGWQMIDKKIKGSIFDHLYQFVMFRNPG
jgi:hypothetical protein